MRINAVSDETIAESGKEGDEIVYPAFEECSLVLIVAKPLPVRVSEAHIQACEDRKADGEARGGTCGDGEAHEAARGDVA